MKIAFIVGSPKIKYSTSEALLKSLENMIPNAEAEWIYSCNYSDVEADEIFDRISNCDSIVLAFPLYINSIPSHMLRLMQAIEKRSKGGGKHFSVYTIVNCGFYESENAETAIEIVKLWSARAKMVFAQAVALGGGGTVYSSEIGEGSLISYGEVLSELATNIFYDKGGETLSAIPDIPRYKFVSEAHKDWKKAAEKRGITNKELHGKYVNK